MVVIIISLGGRGVESYEFFYKYKIKFYVIG